MSSTLENMTDTELLRQVVKGEVEAALDRRDQEAKAKAEKKAADPFEKRMEKYRKKG